MQERDDYQGDAGNVCHNHLILAIDKSTMNESTENYIQDLIRTSVFEVVKTNEDIPRLLDNGLLHSIEEEVQDIHQCANVILLHKCDERCLVRVGEGDDPSSFRCRKMNSVWDSPDTTCHNYLPFKLTYKSSTLEVLEQIGLYVPPGDTNDVNLKGNFHHAFFNPSRHIPPCNINADCNTSPVIPDFFVAFKSMQNTQALDHTNGLAKYVCKYISKFVDCNYVVLCQDIHTGQWILGKNHLHNTKIVSSKINEDKAFEQRRYKNHPKGRDMPYFEIRQIILGDAEVFNDLCFVPLSTLPFELRPSNKVEIDSKGKVINPNPDYDAEAAENISDSYESEIPMQKARIQADLSVHQLVTGSQLLTRHNHNRKACRSDKISIFC